MKEIRSNGTDVTEPTDQPEPPVARPIAGVRSPELLACAGAPSSSNPLVVSQPWQTTLLDLFLAGVGFIVLLIGVEFLTDLTLGRGLDDPPHGGWVQIGQRMLLGGLIAAVLLLLIRKNGQSAASLGLRRGGSGMALLWGAIAYGTIMAYLLGVGFVVSLIWPGVEKAMEQGQAHNLERLPNMSLGVALLFSLAVAVSEELFFRGFVVTRLRSLTRSWTAAILLSSAIFALLHIPQGWLPVALIFGLSALLGFWLAWRRNLIVPILAHTLFDTTSLMLMNNLFR